MLKDYFIVIIFSPLTVFLSFYIFITSLIKLILFFLILSYFKTLHNCISFALAKFFPQTKGRLRTWRGGDKDATFWSCSISLAHI